MAHVQELGGGGRGPAEPVPSSGRRAGGHGPRRLADDRIGSRRRAGVRRRRPSDDPRLSQVLICTPDKDLGQCVRGSEWSAWTGEKAPSSMKQAVRERFGVGPRSVPDWLALVGDSADGYPGLAGWGAKTTSIVLARYGSIEAIPASATAWNIDLLSRRAPVSLAATLRKGPRPGDCLFKKLATCVVNRGIFPGGRQPLTASSGRAGSRVRGYVPAPGRPGLLKRARKLAARRAPSSSPGSAKQTELWPVDRLPQELVVAPPADPDGTQAGQVRRQPLHVEQGATSRLAWPRPGPPEQPWTRPADDRTSTRRRTALLSATPYSPPESSPSADHDSTLCAHPSSCRRR